MPSLADFRHDLALKAARLKILTTGVLYSGTYQGTASGADAARRIVSSDLASVNLAGTASEAPSSAYQNEWAYVPSTAEQRRMVKNGYSGYNAASSVLTGQNASADAYIVGRLTLDRALATALAGNTTVETYSRFPAQSNEDMPGLHWAIGEALSVMHWPFKVAITATDSTRRYDMTSLASWFKRPEQLIRVFGPDPNNGDGPPTMSGRPWIEPDGEKLYLHVPEQLNAGQIFYAQVRRPAKTWIKVAGTWANSTVGLVNETDEALPDVDRVTAVAYWHLCLRMSRKGPKPQQAEWAAEEKQAAADAAPFVEWQNEPSTPTHRQPYIVPMVPGRRRGIRLVGSGGYRWP